MLGYLRIIAHGVDNIVHLRAIAVENIDNGFAISDKILDKDCLAIFSKIAGAVLGTAYLSVAISGEDAQEVINELRRRSAALTKLLQFVGSLYLRI